MSGAASGNVIRSRKTNTSLEGPPVPPKRERAASSILQRRGLRGPQPPKSLKPLPRIPSYASGQALVNEQGYKPLPKTPQSSILRPTLFWILGFCLWFLLIVLLLPIITEKEAMPGFNRWLRKWSL